MPVNETVGRFIEIAAFLVTILVGVLALVLKGRKQSICTNVLLVVATISPVFSWYLSLHASAKTHASNPMKMPVTYEADLLQLSFTMGKLCPYAGEDFPDLKRPAPTDDREKDRKAILAYSNDYLKKLVEAHPKNEGLILRRCLILRESGEDAEGQFVQYLRTGQTRRLHYFSPIFRADGDHSDGTKQDIIQRIESTLPPGWYRQSALLGVYDLFGDPENYVKVLDQRTHAVMTRTFELYWAFAYFWVVTAIGAMVVWSFLWLNIKKPRTSTKCDSSLTLKSCYGSALFILYCASIGAVVAFVYVMVDKEMFAATPTLRIWAIQGSALGVELAATILAVYLFVIRTKQLQSFKDLFILQPGVRPWTSVQTGIYGFCATVFIVSIVNIIMTTCFHYEPSGGGAVRDLLGFAVYPNLTATALAILVVAVIAPIAEELLFRGLFYRWLRKYLPPLTATLISGLVFAACHFNPAQFLLLAIPGFTLAIVFERSKSLWASMITHGLYNLSVTFWMFFST